MAPRGGGAALVDGWSDLWPRPQIDHGQRLALGLVHQHHHRLHARHQWQPFISLRPLGEHCPDMGRRVYFSNSFSACDLALMFDASEAIGT